MVLPLASCGDDAPVDDVVSITESRDGTTVRLEPGQRLEVTLEGNPSTGYNWTTLRVDPAVLRVVGAELAQPETALLGAPGPVTLCYEWAGPGTTQLELGYLRTWEDEPPLDRFLVTVIAQ